MVFSWAVPCFSLFIACVKLCTNRSARLLVAGWNGAVVICLIPFIFKNIWNYAEVNCGPLSVTNCAGTLYRANKVRGRSMVWTDVVDGMVNFQPLRVGIHYDEKHSTKEWSSKIQIDPLARCCWPFPVVSW